MLNPKNITYVYDGSLDGLLCCVFEALEKGEFPQEIRTDAVSFFDLKHITTDAVKAKRMQSAISKRMGHAALDTVKMAYLAEFDGMELAVVRFLDAGFRYGLTALDRLSDDNIMAVMSPVRKFNREVAKFVQFVRFTDNNGALVSIIEPEGNVLPLIARHFVQRLPSETFLIYDKNRRAALVHDGGECTIINDFDLTPTIAENHKDGYGRLWKVFYDTIEIKQRHNERCRQNFMPKKYWKHMTEFM